MKLQDAMKGKGLNDRTLAALVGVSRPFITRIRLGKRTPSLAIAAKVAKETGLTVDDLVKAA